MNSEVLDRLLSIDDPAGAHSDALRYLDCDLNALPMNPRPKVGVAQGQARTRSKRSPNALAPPCPDTAGAFIPPAFVGDEEIRAPRFHRPHNIP